MSLQPAPFNTSSFLKNFPFIFVFLRVKKKEKKNCYRVSEFLKFFSLNQYHFLNDSAQDFGLCGLLTKRCPLLGLDSFPSLFLSLVL